MTLTVPSQVLAELRGVPREVDREGGGKGLKNMDAEERN